MLPRRSKLLMETSDSGLGTFNFASWASNFASWASNFTCKRRQFGHNFRALGLMAGYTTSLVENTQHR